jgi:translocation and assembly module TamA
VSRRIAFLIALVLGVVAAPASPPAGAQESGVTYRVELQAPKELREMLQEGLQLMQWRDDPQMSAELLQRLAEEAVKEAADAVATRGYFSASVTHSIDRGVTPWVVTLRIDPGPRTVVRDIDLQFTGPAAQDPAAASVFRKVRREWLLRRGEPFTQEGWEEAKRDAVRKLSAWRYAAARVASSEARIDPATSSAALRVELDSGPPFRFGPVDVSGTRRYPESLVENLSPIRPGDVYDRNLLVLYARRLLESGYFAGARVDVAPEAKLAQAAPVRAGVIEGSSQHLETGISYNTDTRARLELRHRNADLYDSAWRLKSELRLDEAIRQARVDVDSPPRRGATWRNHFVSLRESTIQQETNSELSFGVSHNWATAAAPSSLIVSAHVDEQRVEDRLIDRRHAVYFGFRRTWRQTDDLIAPRSGYLGILTAGGSPPGLSSQEFARGTAQLALFIPLARRSDLALRGEAGVVWADQRAGIPSSFLFRTGGDNTVRGYAFESLGVALGNAVVGGRYLAIGSAEYIQWLADNWGAAVFVDAGNAWDSGHFEPAVGAGFGGRFRTPIGPVRADLAYGEQTRSRRDHFSVGFTF